jgi:hypothetical protein
MSQGQIPALSRSAGMSSRDESSYPSSSAHGRAQLHTSHSSGIQEGFRPQAERLGNAVGFEFASDSSLQFKHKAKAASISLTAHSS